LRTVGSDQRPVGRVGVGVGQGPGHQGQPTTGRPTTESMAQATEIAVR
jgi:hypothetical protein